MATVYGPNGGGAIGPVRLLCRAALRTERVDGGVNIGPRGEFAALPSNLRDMTPRRFVLQHGIGVKFRIAAVVSMSGTPNNPRAAGK